MNYYNEFDPEVAAWLQELINRGLIPNGDVDTRSITEIKPHELTKYTQCHFFAGIGGWSLALQLAGWPADTPVWTGSCPCQPFSSAGNNLGTEDERHLWPIFFNLIKECRPQHVFGEQVANAVGAGWLDGVSTDLEEAGYTCGSVVLGAHSVGAPHIRQRIYWGATKATEWKRVVHADECIYAEWDEDREQPTCPICAGEYGGWGVGVECTCPGPTEDGYEFQERDGTLYARWVGNPQLQGPQGHTRSEAKLKEPGWDTEKKAGPGLSAGNVPDWAGCSVIPCLDGKQRRIPSEPAFFPLATRVPSRMVRLRGYGNAIVPQVAAEFITAFTEETKIFTKSLDV
jgi:DNA (cytosine-5)-methyltransferase 1